VPGGGGRSEWERCMAAQRREAERQAKEQARLAREREKAAKEAHLLAQQGAAEAKTAAVEQQIRDLDEVVASALPRRPVSFSGLMAPSAPPHFEPGALAAGNPPPDWADFAPVDPKGLARIFGGNSRHARATTSAIPVAPAGARRQVAGAAGGVRRPPG
jgi:restriction system protein